MRTIALALLLFAFAPGAARADEVEVYRLHVTPAARPMPAMRYRLLPATRDLKPGNSTALEYRAMIEMQNSARTKDQNTISDWLEMPADKFPRAEAVEMLQRYRVSLRDLARAARRERIDWDIPLREDGIETLLNEIQEARSFGRMLSLEARVAILDRDYARAAETLATSFVLARHVGESSTLVSSLVGIAITGIAANDIRAWIRTPGSPNLYWALTALPDPPVTVRTGMQSEELYVTAGFPHVDLLETTILSRQQADELWIAAGKLLSDVDDLSSSGRFGLQFSRTAALLPAALSAYPHAKEYLIASGRKAELVEAMPVAQVIVLAWIDVHRAQFDEMLAWLDEPYPEAQQALRDIEDRSSDINVRPEGRLAALFLPSLSAVYMAEVRQSQQIAALRIVEALRLYAVGHEGRLPATLADIREVPVPRDPAPDQPFDYELKQSTAILRPKPLAVTVQYEITIKANP